MAKLVLILFSLWTGAIAVALPGSACSALDYAEGRFAPADPRWFYDTQAELKRQVDRVNAGFAASGAETAKYWKDLFRWDLLEKNLRPGVTVQLADLELVRRWMYSNRKGTESDFFEPLRKAMDAHLDAVFTFSHPDLRAAFTEKVALARRQCGEHLRAPTEATGVALGRTLGWFERTRQLGDVVPFLRSRLSHANATFTVSDALIQRIIGDQLKPVFQVTPVSQVLSVPSGLLGGMRSVHVTGTAQTRGEVRLQLVPNESVAQFQLVFSGYLSSQTRGNQEPVTTYSQSWGPVSAWKSLFLTPGGLRLGGTQVHTPIQTQVTGIDAPGPIVGRIAQRRANRPAVRSAMQGHAQSQASSQLATQFTAQVEGQFAQAQRQGTEFQQKLKGFSEVLAPIEREGASPRLLGSRTGADWLEVQFMEQTALQFGAVTPCPRSVVTAEVVGCVHQSFLNNMLETVMGGKTYTDTYFQEGAKILQPELPLPLLVHSRAPRWSVTVRKERPVEIALNGTDDIRIRMHLTGAEVGHKSWAGTAVAAVDYRLTKDDYDEYRLERKGELTLTGEMDEELRKHFHSKLDAFFAPVLDGGGVIVPDGGILGALKGIRGKGFRLLQGWFVIGVDVPKEVLQAVQKL